MILQFIQKIFAERVWNIRLHDRSTGELQIVELNVSKGSGQQGEHKFSSTLLSRFLVLLRLHKTHMNSDYRNHARASSTVLQTMFLHILFLGFITDSSSFIPMKRDRLILCFVTLSTGFACHRVRERVPSCADKCLSERANLKLSSIGSQPVVSSVQFTNYRLTASSIQPRESITAYMQLAAFIQE